MTSSRSALVSVVAATLAMASLLEPGLAWSQQSHKSSAAAAHDGDAAEITFTGYRSLATGGGVLFVEMTKSVEVEVEHNGRRVEYKLVGARVPLRNNRNPLVLAEFDANATSARLVNEKVKRGKHAKRAKHTPEVVRLVIELRSDAVPPHRLVQRGQGYALEIVLPGAQSAAATSPAATSSKPTK
jgi:hypothetical protein